MNIHIIWIGLDIPTSVENNINAWRKKYSECVVFWGNKELKEQFSDYEKYSALKPAQMADIFRVKICKQYGGWYVDADTIPGELIITQSEKVVLTKESNSRVLNGFFHLPTKHEFAEIWLTEIHESLKETFKSVSDQTGPGALNRAIVRYAQKKGIAFARNEFQFISPSKFRMHESLLFPKIPKSYLKTSYAVHLGYRTWQTDQLPNTLLAKIKRRIFQFSHANKYSLQVFSILKDYVRLAKDNFALFQNYPTSLFSRMIGGSRSRSPFRNRMIDVELHNFNGSFESAPKTPKEILENREILNFYINKVVVTEFKILA